MEGLFYFWHTVFLFMYYREMLFFSIVWHCWLITSLIIKVSPGLHSAELSRQSFHKLQVQIILTECNTLRSFLLYFSYFSKHVYSLSWSFSVILLLFQILVTFPACYLEMIVLPIMVKKRNVIRPRTDIWTTWLHKVFSSEQHTTTLSFPVFCPPTLQ